MTQLFELIIMHSKYIEENATPLNNTMDNHIKQFRFKFLLNTKPLKKIKKKKFV